MINYISIITIPIIILIIIISGIKSKINIFENFVNGVNEGVKLSFSLFPTLLGIILMINLILKCGIIENISQNNLINKLNIPNEIIPLALFRPISGSGSIGIIKDIIENKGPDSIACKLAMTIAGSTETTLYTIMIYTSYVNLKVDKKIIIIGLVGDIVALTTALLIWL